MLQRAYFKMKCQCEMFDILETYSVVFTVVVVVVFIYSLFLYLFHMHLSLVTVRLWSDF